MQIFFTFIPTCFYCFYPHCRTIKPNIWYFENGLLHEKTHAITYDIHAFQLSALCLELTCSQPINELKFLQVCYLKTNGHCSSRTPCLSSLHNNLTFFRPLIFKLDSAEFCYLGRFPFGRTGRPDPSVCKEHTTIWRNTCTIIPRILPEEYISSSKCVNLKAL